MSATSKEGRRLTAHEKDLEGLCSCGDPGVRQILYVARLWRCEYCIPKIYMFLWVDLNRLS